MADDESQTELDRQTKKLKNKPWVARLIIATAVIAGTAGLLTNISAVIAFFTPHPQEAPKVRVTYYTVGGHAISYLLVGALDPALREHLGGRPIVWQNDVYDEVLRIQNTFSNKFAEGNELVSAEMDINQLGKRADSINVLPFSVRDSLPLDAANWIDDPNLGDPLTDSSWKVAWIKDRPTADIVTEVRSGWASLEGLVFSKRLSCKQAIDTFGRLDLGIASFLRTLGAPRCNGLDFDIVAKYHGEGCGEEGWTATVYLPGLSMDIAVVENISDKPVRINQIDLSSRKVTGIDTVDHASTPIPTKGSIGDGVLLGTDRLIIPLALRFSDESEASNMTALDKTYDRVDVGSAAMRDLISDEWVLRLYTYRNTAGGDRIAAPRYSGSATATTKLPKEEAPTSQPTPTEAEAEPASNDPGFSYVPLAKISTSELSRRYGYTPIETRRPLPYIGTLLQPTSLVVDDISSSVHAAKKGSMFITDEFVGGSCPYLFAQNNGLSQNLGKILVDRNSSLRHGTDSRYVTYWPTKIIVSELDPETTFLGAISLKCETFDGQIIARTPASMSPEPGRPIRQGERAEATFLPLDPGVQCKGVFVMVNGHYLPDKERVARRNVYAVARKVP